MASIMREDEESMVQLSPEEELEKQYRDYKAQFEQWKEKNKNSVGTEAYILYVKQFEAWERDVDQRREMIRAKAELDIQEAQAVAQAKAKAAAEAKLKEQEAEEEKKKQLEAETAAQAAAYAQHQQSYLAHHQSAMQKEQQMQQATVASSHESLSMHTESKSVDETLDPAHVAEMVKHMAQVAQLVMGDQQDVSYHQAAQQAAVAAQMVPPPQLWGTDRIMYDANDPMYKRWGLRAAPPYHKPVYKPPPPDYQVTPCWLYVEQMKEEKLMLAPQVNMPPPPFVPSFIPS